MTTEENRKTIWVARAGGQANGSGGSTYDHVMTKRETQQHLINDQT